MGFGVMYIVRMHLILIPGTGMRLTGPTGSETQSLRPRNTCKVIEWFNQSHRIWLENLGSTDERQLDELRPVHWGEKVPLYDIVVMIAGHHVYHAGELNQVLSICKGEAWEEGEEVEENNISTIGHRVKPPWLAGDQQC